MKTSTKKLLRKKLSVRELPLKKQKLLPSIHLFKRSRTPMSIEIAKKARVLFDSKS